MEGSANPVVRMLAWKSKLLGIHEVEMILAAVASVESEEFMLRDILSRLPSEVSSDPKKSRSISAMLNVLSEIGYLQRRSERKWRRVSSSLSHYLSPLLIELSEVERKPLLGEKKEDRVVKISRE
ncbi:MAG: hypothetical protein OEY99_07225 [Aigarchaeota archaeon]|nr:hypothetical protein [Aigarchaeota archaeon]MDH5703992.1 hypothetical protein [Aigarchaeota archaeon]